MKTIIKEKDTHLVCHNGEGLVHYVHIKKGNVLNTYMEIIEEFETLDDAKLRVSEITSDENYFDNNF